MYKLQYLETARAPFNDIEYSFDSKSQLFDFINRRISVWLDIRLRYARVLERQEDGNYKEIEVTTR